SVYDALPAPLQALHDFGTDLTVAGIADVERGTGALSRLIAWVVGFPAAGRDVPVVVTFHARDRREHWRRSFSANEFASVQEEGSGRNEQLLCERFGPLNFAMALVWDAGRLTLVLRRWSVLEIPLPLALGPRINSYEFAENDRFRFHVEIRHPLAGLIVAY